jgi:hypothetical protein
LLTVPPFEIVSAEVPLWPTTRFKLLVQVEFAPSTIAVPSEPEKLPSTPRALLTVPPFEIISVPVPALPT